MRATACLFRGPGRSPAKEPFPFVEMLPLKLKNSVSGKSNRISENICLQELNTLLSCLKKRDFNQNLCNSEISAFQKCYKATMEQKKIAQERTKRGEVTKGSKDLTYMEINNILRNYPSK